MLPSNERGEKITIEDVFLSLNTRLNNIKIGIDELKGSYTGYEYGYDREESITVIQNLIHGFSVAKSIGAISYPLELIVRIQELITELNGNSNIETKGNWISYHENFDDINRELNQYKSKLEIFQNELLLRLDTEVFVNPEGEKIRMNITVEQLSALLYFLNKDKIFKANLRQLCRAFITVFSQADGEEIVFEYFYNKVTGFKKSESTIKFWNDKFSDYVEQLKDI